VENKNDSKLLGRRRTLQLLGIGLTATGIVSVIGCDDKNKASGGGGGGGSKETKTATADCDSTIDDTSKGLRKTLQYKDTAADPAKKCSGCAQFEAGKYGDCGSCKLFTGPVQPTGGCLSFAPKGAGDAAVPTKT
jgi:hypothetical protein